jgi:hypothetical protein
MRSLVTSSWIVVAAAWLPACLQGEDMTGEDMTGEAVEDLDKASGEQADEAKTAEDNGLTPIDGDAQLNAGVFDVGVIPDLGVGCPANSEEVMIRMDDEDDNNGSSRSGFIGKTNSGDNASNTRFFFCKVDGTAFRPFSGSADAANQRDDYAVVKFGTSCPAGSQEFSRHYDNEDSGNANSRNGVITPNISNANTTLFFCLFRFAAAGVATMSVFPNLGTGFRYGVFAPSDFNRGALAFGRFRSDDEDSGNANTYTVPSDALSSAQRIVFPDTTVSHGATIHRVIRAR